jgi:hypothetical protein
MTRSCILAWQRVYGDRAVHRTGNISWDTDRWGPPPDDAGCLIPWDVLREAG